MYHQLGSYSYPRYTHGGTAAGPAGYVSSPPGPKLQYYPPTPASHPHVHNAGGGTSGGDELYTAGGGADSVAPGGTTTAPVDIGDSHSEHNISHSTISYVDDSSGVYNTAGNPSACMGTTYYSYADRYQACGQPVVGADKYMSGDRRHSTRNTMCPQQQMYQESHSFDDRLSYSHYYEAPENWAYHGRYGNERGGDYRKPGGGAAVDEMTVLGGGDTSYPPLALHRPQYTKYRNFPFGGVWSNKSPSTTYHEKCHSPRFRLTPGANRPDLRSEECGTAYGYSNMRGSEMLPNVGGDGAGDYHQTNRPHSPLLSAADLCSTSSYRTARSDTTHEGNSSHLAVSQIGKEEGAIQLMVSNLDYNISAREWKKILFSEFQQHVTVIGVHVQTQADNTNVGFVQLPSVDIARYAISQFHRKKIGYKRIHVTLFNEESVTVSANTRAEIVALLREIPSHSAALFKFIEMFEKRFYHSISVSELYRMRDIVQIEGQYGGGRTVKLLEQYAPHPNYPKLDLSRPTPAPAPSTAPVPLHHHHMYRGVEEGRQGVMYGGAYEETEAKHQGESGGLAGDMLGAFGGGSGLYGGVDGGAMEASPEMAYCKQHCDENHPMFVEALNTLTLPSIMMQLKTFSSRVHTMLQSHDGQMPLLSFQVCYASEFSQNISPRSDGVPLEQLISSVPGVRIAVSKHGIRNVQWCENKPLSPVSLHSSNDSIRTAGNATPPGSGGSGSSAGGSVYTGSPMLGQQLNQFCREVVDLLKSHSGCRLQFTKFIPSYHHHFGRQCRVADYGYTKLIELLESIPHVVQIIGGGSRRVVTLSHRSQVKRFTSDLLKILKSQASRQLSVLELPHAYNKVIGKDFSIKDYGVCYIEDMLYVIPEASIVVTGAGPDMVIAIPRREQTTEEVERVRQFAVEAVDLLRHSPQCRMQFNKFIPAYHHHFGRQCRVSDYGFTKLIELFEAVPEVIKIVEEEDKWLCLTDAELLTVLEDQVATLLQATPQHCLDPNDFQSAYLRHYGHALHLQDYCVDSVVELIEKIPDVAKLEVMSDGRLVIILVDHSHSQQLACRILLLMMDQTTGTTTVQHITELYHQVYGYHLNMTEARAKLANYVQFSDEGDNNKNSTVKMTSLQMFARDARSLMHGNQGKLGLDQLEAAYLQQYGVALVPASYGHSSVLSLLQAIPHVLVIRGKGYRRMILLAPEFQEKLQTLRFINTSPIPDVDIVDPDVPRPQDPPLYPSVQSRATPVMVSHLEHEMRSSQGNPATASSGDPHNPEATHHQIAGFSRLLSSLSCSDKQDQQVPQTEASCNNPTAQDGPSLQQDQLLSVAKLPQAASGGMLQYAAQLLPNTSESAAAAAVEIPGAVEMAGAAPAVSAGVMSSSSSMGHDVATMLHTQHSAAHTGAPCSPTSQHHTTDAPHNTTNYISPSSGFEDSTMQTSSPDADHSTTGASLGAGSVGSSPGYKPHIQGTNAGGVPGAIAGQVSSSMPGTPRKSRLAAKFQIPASPQQHLSS